MCDGDITWVHSCADIKSGAPVIMGTRLTVSVVQGCLTQGDTLADLADDYPHIPLEALRAAAAYRIT